MPLRHILGSLFAIFEICHFMTIPGLFEYLSEKGSSQKGQVCRSYHGPILLDMCYT